MKAEIIAAAESTLETYLGLTDHVERQAAEYQAGIARDILMREDHKSERVLDKASDEAFRSSQPG
jgi:hypothetical protein